MITKNQFEKLSVYLTSSWAVWSDDFIKPDCRKCIENEEGQPKKYFKNNLSLLKNNIILLGLNPSGDKEIQRDASSNFLGNFHSVIDDYGRRHKGDLFLSNNIMKLNNIKGAYMTDISDEIEGKSPNVCPDEHCVKKELEDKLIILGSENVHIVCFGWKVFNIINRNFGNRDKKADNKYGVKEFSIKWKNKNITFYKVYHYSYSVRYGADKKDKFRRQLEYVNKMAGK